MSAGPNRVAPVSRPLTVHTVDIIRCSMNGRTIVMQTGSHTPALTASMMLRERDGVFAARRAPRPPRCSPSRVLPRIGPRGSVAGRPWCPGTLDAGEQRARSSRAPTRARREQRLLKVDVLELVHLLVVDQQVEVLARQDLVLVPHGRRHHAVELAHLARALEHLDRVLVVRHLVRHRHEDAEPAEGARLVALHARLKVGDGALAALGVPVRATRV